MVSYRHSNREGTEILNTVKSYGTCARVNVPVAWIGKAVKVVLLVEDKKDEPVITPQA